MPANLEMRMTGGDEPVLFVTFSLERVAVLSPA